MLAVGVDVGVDADTFVILVGAFCTIVACLL